MLPLLAGIIALYCVLRYALFIQEAAIRYRRNEITFGQSSA